MRAVPLPDPDPVVAAAIGKKYGGKKKAPLAVAMRDRLGEWMTDGLFAEAFGARGRPGLPPAMLAVVTVLQFAYDMDDRAAAEAVETRLDWQYALGLPLDAPGFDHSVLSEFRTRVAGHGLEQAALDALLARLAEDRLVKARGKQRTDSTHVIAAVRALHTTELAGESVRAALEALAAASPDWLAARFCTADWTRRYGARVDSWRLPPGKAERDKLIIEFARDGYALVSACYEDSAPAWARDLPAVQVLRTVLVQNFHLDRDEHGQEVITRREPGRESGLPPAHIRISSPYDPDASWGAKRDQQWLGYKLHITETCDDPPGCGCGPGTRTPACHHDTLPNLVTHVATTDAAVADADMTIPVIAALAAKGLPPARHYLDSGYASAAAVLEAARQFGITLVTPLPADTSRQARQAGGYDRSAFTIDYDARTATCPQGHASRYWHEPAIRGKPAVVVQFAAADCKPCPARAQCTTARHGGRGLTLLPRDQHDLQAAARATQPGKDWQHDYKRRAGIEATISQAVTVTGTRRARYRGLAKTRLEHAYAAVALNLCRLDAYWNDTPIDRTRTSHLARLDLSLRDTAPPTELTTSILGVAPPVTSFHPWSLRDRGICALSWFARCG
ncbi:MAG TPA: IS1182 family transposase [Trebonia sp.]